MLCPPATLASAPLRCATWDTWGQPWAVRSWGQPSCLLALLKGAMFSALCFWGRTASCYCGLPFLLPSLTMEYSCSIETGSHDDGVTISLCTGKESHSQDFF